MALELFPLFTDHTCLIVHSKYVFKLKLIYTDAFGEHERHDLERQGLTKLAAHIQLEQVLRAVLYMIERNQHVPSIHTKDFIVHPQTTVWPLAGRIEFVVDEKVLFCYPDCLVFHIRCKPLVNHRNQAESDLSRSIQVSNCPDTYEIQSTEDYRQRAANFNTNHIGQSNTETSVLCTPLCKESTNLFKKLPTGLGTLQKQQGQQYILLEESKQNSNNMKSSGATSRGEQNNSITKSCVKNLENLNSEDGCVSFHLEENLKSNDKILTPRVNCRRKSGPLYHDILLKKKASEDQPKSLNENIDYEGAAEAAVTCIRQYRQEEQQRKTRKSCVKVSSGDTHHISSNNSSSIGADDIIEVHKDGKVVCSSKKGIKEKFVASKAKSQHEDGKLASTKIEQTTSKRNLDMGKNEQDNKSTDSTLTECQTQRQSSKSDVGNRNKRLYTPNGDFIYFRDEVNHQVKRSNTSYTNGHRETRSDSGDVVKSKSLKKESNSRLNFCKKNMGADNNCIASGYKQMLRLSPKVSLRTPRTSDKIGREDKRDLSTPKVFVGDKDSCSDETKLSKSSDSGDQEKLMMRTPSKQKLLQKRKIVPEVESKIKGLKIKKMTYARQSSERKSMAVSLRSSRIDYLHKKTERGEQMSLSSISSFASTSKIQAKRKSKRLRNLRGTSSASSTPLGRNRRQNVPTSKSGQEALKMAWDRLLESKDGVWLIGSATKRSSVKKNKNKKVQDMVRTPKIPTRPSTRSTSSLELVQKERLGSRSSASSPSLLSPRFSDPPRQPQTPTPASQMTRTATSSGRPSNFWRVIASIFGPSSDKK